MALDIRYARNGGVAIAYQVVGDGATDLAYVPDYCSNLVYGWEVRHWREFYERLAQSFRLILFDKRGTGLSDHGGQFTALETRMEDLHAVLDAAGSSSTVLLASHDGCSMAALYAATYPERTRALVLFHPVAYASEGQSEYMRAQLAELRARWGTQELSDEIFKDIAPSLYTDPAEREWFANWLRVGASPAAAYALNRAWFETDLSEVLPAVRVPTLVMYRPALDAERNGLEVTDLIPSAHALRVSGSDYGQIHLSPEIPEEVARFVAREEIPEVPDSVLATVLFTERRLDRAGGRARGSCVARAARAAPCSRPPGAGPFPRRGARHRGRRLLRDVRRPRAGYPLRPGTRRRRSRSRARVARRRPHRRVRAPRRQGRGPGRLDRCPGRRHRRGERGARLADGQGSRRRHRARPRGPRRPGAEGSSRQLAPLPGYFGMKLMVPLVSRMPHSTSSTDAIC